MHVILLQTNCRQQMNRKTIFLFLLFIYGQNNFAQLSLTIQQCEDLLQKNCFALLAEQYNIEASKAAVIQARIWEQPYISGEINAINPSANKYFDLGNSGQKTLAVQQLIYLGGKKRNEIEVAKSNFLIAELEYEQLLRNLKFQLVQNFYEIYFNQKKAQNINLILTNLDTLIKNYALQSEKGHIPLKDLVRLQSLSLSFKNELLDIHKQISDQEEVIHVLTNTLEKFIAVVDEVEINSKYQMPLTKNKEQLIDLEFTQNAEYLASLKLIENQELMYKWQKSLSTPDFTLGANYDQNGGAFKNQVNLTFGIPLPLWNRNKGNIKIAEAQINQAKFLSSQKKLELSSKMSNVLSSFKYQQEQYLETIQISENFKKVYAGMIFNFQKRNVAMLEFTDFLESYNKSVMYLYEIKKQVIISGETINYLTNEKVF